MRLRNRRGFTLVELLVVIAIIGILAAVVAPNAFRAIEKAKISRVKADAKNLRSAALSYYADMGFFPPDVNRGVDPGLMTKVTSNLTTEQIATLNQNWNGPYMDRWPDTTPWGGEYDWNLWKVRTNRNGHDVEAGLYIGIVPAIGSSTVGAITPEGEKQLYDEGFDSDGSASNREVQLLLVRWDDYN